MLEVGTGFHQELTGRENIYMNGAILGMSRKEVDSKVESIIDFSECRQFIDTPVKRYSSGMYVKLAFAVASHLDSEILVMDEVLAVGDMKFQKKCLGKMGDAASNEGRTILYVSHNMATIRSLCERCIVLNKGEIIFDGDVEKAIERYMEEFTRELPSYYNLSSYKRDGIGLGTNIFMNSIEFINKKSAIFRSDEQVDIQIKWRQLEEIEFYFRIIISLADGTAIGLIDSSDSINYHAFSLGEEYSALLQIDISPLIAGKYLLRIEAYRFNGGLSFQVDESPSIPVEVLKGNNCKYHNWVSQYWGRVMLGDILYR